MCGRLALWVALGQLFVGETLEPLGLFSLVLVAAVAGGVDPGFTSEIAINEVVEVAALEWIFFYREMFVGVQVVNPKL